jgi:hypothetical protein
MVVFFIGLGIAGWIPPEGPGASAAETARMYQQNTNEIRLAAVIIMIGGTLFGPMIAVISAQIKRIEGPGGPLAYLQLGMGFVGGTAFFIIPTFFWMTAAYEPFRDPDVTRSLHIAGWLPIMCAIWPAVFQNISIAIAVFADRRADPVFPRWVGYMNLWVALLFFPAGLVLFFHDGPFAFNGAFGFFVPCAAFTVWCVCMFVVTRRAINQQEAEAAAATAQEPDGTALRDSRARQVPAGV